MSRPYGVLLSALAVVALRLPSVTGTLGPDEAGFLTVGRGWNGRGTALYGDSWVDRPPLLITIFRVADRLGGGPALRVIGILAAVVTVLAVARAAHVLAGSRAAAWASVATAALLVSPLAGAQEVNGELLAAPFVAVAVLATVEARRSLRWAPVAGAAAVLAVLVKQNMLDGFVFAGVLLALSARELGARRLLRIVAAALGGAVLAGAAVALWTVAHGTSLSAVWFAMYRFRLEANAVMAADPSSAALHRGVSLARAGVTTGMVLVAVLLLVTLVRARSAALAAFAVVVLYDVVSIFLGGNYWSHYLVELAVPLGLTAGLAAVRFPRTGRLTAAVLAVSALVSLLAHNPPPPSPVGGRLGTAVAAVARPGDTIVTVWGHAQVTASSGLASPYPYLWYLPARTLDPRMTSLTATLTGSRAPTWFVTWSSVRLKGVDTKPLSAALKNDYHLVGAYRGHKVYLRDGVSRPAPLPENGTQS